MRLKPDCIRYVLLYLEENLSLKFPLTSIPNGEYTYDDIAYTLKKLDEAEYINATVLNNGRKNYIIKVFDITWKRSRIHR